MMSQTRWTWPLIVLVSALAAGISAFALPGTLLCMVMLLWFLLVCPGMLVVRSLRLKEPAAGWMLAIGLSIAIDALVAAIALYTGAWYPPGILGILMTLCIFGVIAQFVLAQQAPLPGIRHAGSKASSPELLFLLLALVVMLSGLGIWSYNMHSLKRAQAPAPKAAALDAVIVMDNVGSITRYDPQGERYEAAQLFANMLPNGSEVGMVRITSTQTPVRVFPLQALRASSDRERVLNMLTVNALLPADASPVAYFTPALEMAGTMLSAKPASDHKLIVIFTDALALSGDQHACASALDAHHLWFCTVEGLAQQRIAVSLVGFAPLGDTATLQPVQQFFAAYGGFTVPVSDGPDLAAQLTTTYRAWLGAA